MGTFRFVEEVALADCAFDVEGADLNDLFETAARALTAIMVDPATVPSTCSREVVLTAGALDLLLYDWLSELILRKDRDREVFPEAHVTVIQDCTWRLVARLTGSVIDAACMALRADAKAVTFHQFHVARTPEGWAARVVVDI